MTPIKPDWRKLESGSAPLPYETVLLYGIKEHGNVKGAVPIVHSGWISSSYDIPRISHWAPFPQFLPPEGV